MNATAARKANQYPGPKLVERKEADIDRRKYRTEIPNSIDDMDLSVYAFRLYCHIKRVAGDSGQCWESIRTLAAACKMSKSAVSRAKQELADAGLVNVDVGAWDRGKSDTISIVDIWDENYQKYMPIPVPVGDTLSLELPKPVPGQPQTCPSEGHPVPVVGHKKEPYKKEPITTKKEQNNNNSRGRRQADPEYGILCERYEQEIGLMSTIVADSLGDLLDEYKDHRMILDAIGIAVKANKRTLRYVEGVLRNMRADGKDGNHGSNRQGYSGGNGGTNGKATGTRAEGRGGGIPLSEAEEDRIRELLARNH